VRLSLLHRRVHLRHRWRNRITKFVYLAGPVLGQTKGQANIWRQQVDAALRDCTDGQIVGISPLRCEPAIGSVYAANYADPKFGSARAISSKNLYDTKNCDITLVYLPPPVKGQPVSLGAIIELAWAYALGKPTVLVTEDPRMLSHPLVSTCSSWVVPNLEDAIVLIIGILDGYEGGKNV